MAKHPRVHIKERRRVRFDCYLCMRARVCVCVRVSVCLCVCVCVCPHVCVPPRACACVCRCACLREDVGCDGAISSAEGCVHVCMQSAYIQLVTGACAGETASTCHIHTHARMHACTQTYKGTRIHTCKRTYIHMRACMRTYTHVCSHATARPRALRSGCRTMKPKSQRYCDAKAPPPSTHKS